MRTLPLLALFLATMATAHAQYGHPSGDACPDRPHYHYPPQHRPILGRVIDELRLIRREVSDLFYWDGGYYYPPPPRYFPHPPRPVYRDNEAGAYDYRGGSDEQVEGSHQAPFRPRYGDRGRIAEQLPQTRAEDDFILPGPRWEPPPRERLEPEAQASAAPASPSTNPRQENMKREGVSDETRRGEQSEEGEAAGDTKPQKGPFTEAEKRNFPWATRTDKPGFVRSPYPPHELMDVTAFEYGDLAREPEGGRIFRVPR